MQVRVDVVGAHWPLGRSGLGSLGRLGAPRPSWCRRMPAVLWGCRGRKHRARGRDAPGPVTVPDSRNPVPSTYGSSGAGCLAGGWKGSHVSGRTQPPPSSCCRARWGPRSHEIPGPGLTTWSPSSGPGRCLTAGVGVLNGHPTSTSIYTTKDQENRSENTASHQPRTAPRLWACCPARGFVAILPKHQLPVRCSSGTLPVPSP